MLSLRRARIAVVLAVPVLLAGCGGEVVDGSGTGAGSASPTDFPSSSSSASSSSAGSPTGVPTAPSTGATSSAPSAHFDTLTGSATSLLLDPSFVRALTALTLTPGTVGTTKLSGRALAFPITGGNATTYTVGGTVALRATVRHEGSGLSLRAGSTTVELTGFTFEFDTTPSVTGNVSINGKPVIADASLFDLDTGSAHVGSAGPAISVLAVGVRVGADFAALLDKAFGTTAFTASLEVGEATLTLTGR